MDQDKITRKDFLSTIGRGLLGLAAVGSIPIKSDAAQLTTPQLTALPFNLVLTIQLDPKMPKLLGIAIDKQDRIYAAGASGIKIFERNGKLIREIKTSGPACAVAIDPEGAIYAAQRAQIEKFSPDGKPLAAWGELGVKPGQFRTITSIAAGERTIYVADAGARAILRFAPDGDYAGQIDGPNDSRGEDSKFKIPSAFFDLALDSKGNLHVGHTGAHRVEKYDANNQLIGRFGKFGPAREDFCGCCNPTNIALFADGRVATTEKGMPRLKVYDAAGKLLACLGPESFPGNAAGMDLAIDSKNRIALVEPVSMKIRFYELRKRKS
ncbi:NHL repeat-containing protein [bacterium]|nr:NHL repeat-containing protein [bacterium]